jgi:hypothetical protein
MGTVEDNFSVVEYLSIFTAFIFGYVASRFFFGWGAMINFRQVIRFSKEHLLWTLITFGLLIDVWWGSWRKIGYIGTHSMLYYVSLIPPLVFYLISVVLFPPLSDATFLDLKKHFEKIRKKNYLLFMALFMSFLLNDIFFNAPETDLLFNLAAIGVALFGYFMTSRAVHYIILALAWGMLLTHLGFLQAYDDSNAVTEGFSLTEYLTVFSAFIYGSVASRFFSAWGNMISKFDRIRFSKDHLAWAVLAFALLLDYWLGSWEREKFIRINVYYFILALLVPMAFYFLTAVLFPIFQGDGRIDLISFYNSQKKIIYLTFGCTLASNSIVANFMENELGDGENLFRLFAISLTPVAYLATRSMVERGVLIAAYVTFALKLIFLPQM